MEKRRIIDAHTHIFPHKIAHKAAEAVCNFYHAPSSDRGSAETLIERGASVGVEKYLVCSAATHPSQVQTINNFLLEECREHPEFIGFGTVHPEYEDNVGELERIKALGMKGLKLQPDMQQFRIDDPRLMAVYKKCTELNLPILLHTGNRELEFSEPEQMVAIARKYPDLTCIAAHFGAYSCWEKCYLYKDVPNVWFDTSSALGWPRMTNNLALELIDMLGPERFFFGSDYPLRDSAIELEYFSKLGLPSEIENMILYENFYRMMGDRL